MSVLTITLGTTDKLQLKVPVKGETNWSNSFKTEFAQKIVDHDHTGVDGKGSKIATAALEDLAVTTAKLANNAVDSTKISSSVVEDKLSAVSIDALSDVDTTTSAPTTGQVLKWSGSVWEPATDQSGSGSGVSITTIASQSDANTYSPSEGDTLKITADVTFDNVTFNKIKMYVAETNTLTFNRGTIDNCEILGGNVNFKAQSTQTMTLKNSKISACDTVTIHQDKVDSDDVVTITVKNVDIVCKEYAYYTTYNTYQEDVTVDRATTSRFLNVSVNFSSIHTPSGSGLSGATADFDNCRFIGATTSGSNLVINKLTEQIVAIGEDSLSNTYYENGNIANNNLVIGTDSGGLFVRVGTTKLTSFS